VPVLGVVRVLCCSSDQTRLGDNECDPDNVQVILITSSVSLT
jgi:hypothetical protein